MIYFETSVGVKTKKEIERMVLQWSFQSKISFEYTPEEPSGIFENEDTEFWKVSGNFTPLDLFNLGRIVGKNQLD